MQRAGSSQPVPGVPKTHSAPLSFSTGLEMNNTKSFDILPEIYKVTLENTEGFYKRGIPYTGTVTGIPHSPALPNLPHGSSPTHTSPLPSLCRCVWRDLVALPPRRSSWCSLFTIKEKLRDTAS